MTSGIRMAVPARAWSTTGLRDIVRRQPLASAGLVVLLAILAVSVAPGLFGTHDPLALDLPSQLVPPSAQHFFGTDELGRDVYSRVIHGTGLTMMSGIGVVLIASVVGTLLGLVAGISGGWIDDVIMRVSDIFLSFPVLIMAMTIVAFLGPNLLNATIAVTIVWWPQYSRLVRGQVLTLRGQPFVEAARAIGASNGRIVFRHILPNTLVPIMVKAGVDFSVAILLTASLSFLGAGAQPPSPELGALVSNGRSYLLSAWWITTFPSLVIFSAVLALNLVSDGVRDLLDPRLRGA